MQGKFLPRVDVGCRVDAYAYTLAQNIAVSQRAPTPNEMLCRSTGRKRYRRPSPPLTAAKKVAEKVSLGRTLKKIQTGRASHGANGPLGRTGRRYSSAEKRFPTFMRDSSNRRSTCG
jgi:hypothetical protein